jgi:hypothetical protein
VVAKRGSGLLKLRGVFGRLGVALPFFVLAALLFVLVVRPALEPPPATEAVIAEDEGATATP